MLPAGLACPIPALIEEVRAGRMVILANDQDPDSDWEVLIAGEFATAEMLNFMARHARGLISLALARQRVEQLGLPAMAAFKTRTRETAFTVSIEARDGVTTGISTADRARTVAVAIDPTLGPEHIVTPGHLFPLVAREGGVLARAGYTEAAVDLARMAQLNPSGVLCQVMRDDGTMARLSDVAAFAERHGLAVGTLADLIAYRQETELRVVRQGEQEINAIGGTWRAVTYAEQPSGHEHLALTKGIGPINANTETHVHILTPIHDLLQENNLTALHAAMRRIEKGVILLLHPTTADNPTPTATRILDDLRAIA